LDFSRKGARKTEPFGAFGISCVMLNESEASALPFASSFDQEVKSRFFVARLLRMTHETKAVLSQSVAGGKQRWEICAACDDF
jgi:hypothetical protein